MNLPGIPRAVVVIAALAALAGCASTPNPSFPLTVQEANDALKEMRQQPREAQRPIVIIGGYSDPGVASSGIRTTLEPCLMNARVLRVDPWTAGSFDEARRMVVDAVQERFPCADPAYTTEVDVVGNSMGGLVALYAIDPTAASASAGTRTLRAARVFTIASPLRGASAAGVPSISSLVVDMRAGSAFITRLGASGCVGLCEVVPYTRSDDSFVGAANTAPLGAEPWWVPADFLHSGHMSAHSDARILADIARRLRGEEPFTREPRAPLPSTAAH